MWVTELWAELVSSSKRPKWKRRPVSPSSLETLAVGGVRSGEDRGGGVTDVAEAAVRVPLEVEVGGGLAGGFPVPVRQVAEVVVAEEAEGPDWPWAVPGSYLRHPSERLPSSKLSE